jgi:hypothetical protein
VDFRWLEVPDLTPYAIDVPFSLVEFVPFNAASPKQIVERLNEAGWKPFEKTKGHIKAERSLKWCKDKAERRAIEDRLQEYQVYGWSISEENLGTLPSTQKHEDWLNYCRIAIPKNALPFTKSIIKETQKKDAQQNDVITIKIKSITEKNSLDEIMELVSKTISEWSKSSTDVVKFVETTSHLWSIIVTPQGEYVDCSVPCATGFWGGLKDTASLQQTISTRKAAQKLVQRLLLASRRSTLETWTKAFRPTSGRIHGNFNHIGAWTGRMSHSDPNMANIPSGETPYAKDMRSLWTTSSDRLLVGVDADAIQLRILAHYINDPVFIEALVNGKKENGTDAHTLNKLALGPICKDRDTSKTYIYAFLLGAGLDKLANILGCSHQESQQAYNNFLEAYPGLKSLKTKVIPQDASRGYFIGLDKRLVMCNNEHLMLAGYLQNGEAVVLKKANSLWRQALTEQGLPFKQINFVHDEYIVETVNDPSIAEAIKLTMMSSIVKAGEILGVRCPLLGTGTIGKNWYEIH